MQWQALAEITNLVIVHEKIEVLESDCIGPCFQINVSTLNKVEDMPPKDNPSKHQNTMLHEACSIES